MNLLFVQAATSNPLIIVLRYVRRIFPNHTFLKSARPTNADRTFQHEMPTLTSQAEDALWILWCLHVVERASKFVSTRNDRNKCQTSMHEHKARMNGRIRKNTSMGASKPNGDGDDTPRCSAACTPPPTISTTAETTKHVPSYTLEASQVVARQPTIQRV